MPNGRKIFDITYYLVKRKNALNCTHCGKRLPAGTELYAKESRNGRLVVCRECVMRLSDQYQNETYGRIPFPKDEPLYVGLVGHFCVDREGKMLPVTAIFRRKKQKAVVPVFHCRKCGRYFISTPEYQKYCIILSEYHLHHTLSDKPFPRRAAAGGRIKEEKREKSILNLWCGLTNTPVRAEDVRENEINFGPPGLLGSKFRGQSGVLLKVWKIYKKRVKTGKTGVIC